MNHIYVPNFITYKLTTVGGGSGRPTPAATGASGNTNPIFLADLVDMGFPKEKCEKALQATGNTSIEAAMDWYVYLLPFIYNIYSILLL